jgi:hypothetical protein
VGAAGINRQANQQGRAIIIDGRLRQNPTKQDRQFNQSRLQGKQFNDSQEYKAT